MELGPAAQLVNGATVVAEQLNIIPGGNGTDAGIQADGLMWPPLG